MGSPSHDKVSFPPASVPHPQAREVLLVLGHNDAVVRDGDCSDDHVQRTSRTPFGRALRHQSRPDQCCLFIEGEHSSPEQRLWAIPPENQRSNSRRLLPSGFCEIPRRTSASVSEQMCCVAIQAINSGGGSGFVTLLMMSVSRRLRLTNRFLARARTGGPYEGQLRPAEIAATR